jgi:hypothetical protein
VGSQDRAAISTFQISNVIILIMITFTKGSGDPKPIVIAYGGLVGTRLRQVYPGGGGSRFNR